MPSILRAPLLLVAASAACTFHETATEWNGRVGVDGRPVFVTTTTKYGFALFAVIPLIGDTRTPELVEEATWRIYQHGSNHLRVIETESSNYWYALPPLSWILSPVVGAVSIEYTPSPAEVQAVLDERGYANPWPGEPVPPPDLLPPTPPRPGDPDAPAPRGAR